MKDYDRLAIKMQITFEVKQFFYRKSHIKQKSMQFALYYNYVVFHHLNCTAHAKISTFSFSNLHTCILKSANSQI